MKGECPDIRINLSRKPNPNRTPFQIVQKKYTELIWKQIGSDLHRIMATMKKYENLILSFERKVLGNVPFLVKSKNIL